MNRLRRATWLLLAAGGGLLAACGPAPGDAPTSGYAEAELVFVAPSTAGLLKTLAVQRGDRVEAGQLLFTLEADAQTLARDAAQARQERAEARASGADLALAAWREGQMQRTAPAEAQVYDVLYRVGEWVPAGAPVVSLLPPGALKLRFFVPETMLAQAVVGREVTVSCDGCAPGLRARIRYVSPQAEFTPPVIYSNDSRSKLVFMAEAEPAAPSDFKPGLPVDVRFAKGP